MLVKEYLAKDKKLHAVFMNSEKAYDRVDFEALWKVMKIFGLRRQLMERIRALYREVNACVKKDGELSNSFTTGVRVRQGCILSLWLFNIFLDGCMREMKAKAGKNRCKTEAEWSGLVSGCMSVCR